ncbi:hypothetical protein AJ79_00590 [Helicocarpus griseus UAMH5409]|uniref:FUN14 domain-containing protein n=1 Tax=Helicocarpus griseus UAMH5409 TaxID=1447875 RepID=A0A2B7YB15_9EURO|nr:hypothetical protein AJ79_00590 [Helicocarpus griseus UAMH5409]
MAFPLLTRLLPSRPLLFAVPLGLSLSIGHTVYSGYRNPIFCDGPPGFAAGPGYSTQPEPSSSSTLSQAAEKIRSRGGISEESARQISLGSVLGLLAGIGLRIFSRALVFALGLGILGVEWAASKGYNIIPTHWLQKHIKSVDVQRLTTEKVPFKVSFGTMMMLAAFAQF